jgi:hypothetical protein
MANSRRQAGAPMISRRSQCAANPEKLKGTPISTRQVRVSRAVDVDRTISDLKTARRWRNNDRLRMA